MILYNALRTIGLACLLLPIACETLDEPLGKGLEGQAGIVNGQETQYEKWQGAIGLFTGYSICTGSLIAPDVVLSAGHCVYLPSEGIDFVSEPSYLQIVGGPIMDVYYAEAEQIITHPTWKGNVARGTDLSMIKLKTPIEGIETYLVRDEDSPTVKTKGILVGYGATKSNSTTTAAVHRWGETTIQSVAAGRIGTGNPSGLCQGDSGGPLFTEQAGRWVVSGVASFITGFCNAKTGSFSVNVVPNRPWIEQTYKDLTGRDLPSPFDEPKVDDEPDTAPSPEGESDTETSAEEPLDGDGEDEAKGDAMDGTGATSGKGCQAAARAPVQGLLSWIWTLMGL
ncbi:MAG: trypsin-like serine protease [Myxococcota bacterium]|jgi:V8-like Glu-specific endopeptidase|nr:trypsin-like serine protease [Myxococcota bacterium]